MRRFRSLALGAGLTMLAACHRGPQGASAARSTPSTSRAAGSHRSAANDITGLVEAPGVGKSLLALKLEFAPETRPVTGVPLAIDLALIPSSPMGAGTLTILADPAFSVAAAERTHALPALGTGSAYRTRVLVIPTAPDVQTLDVDLAFTDAAGTLQGRYALPLIVAGAPAASSATR